MIAVTKDEILAAMAAEQSALAQLLESLDEATMVRPGVYDNLSIKDVLAHLATWELMASEWIQTSLRGGNAGAVYARFSVGRRGHRVDHQPV